MSYEAKSNKTPANQPADHIFERTQDPRPEYGTDTWSIIKLKNSGPGAPTAISVQGSIKCVICSGYSMDQLVCEECVESVKLVRAAGNIEVLKDLIAFASVPGNLAVFQALTDEVAGELMLKRIRDARDGA